MKLDKTFRLRLSSSDLEELERKSSLLEKSKSEYLRDLILSEDCIDCNVPSLLIKIDFV